MASEVEPELELSPGAIKHAMGVVTSVERKQVGECLAGARKAGRGLAAATPFWR